MQIVSIAEYAKACGISRVAAYKRINNHSIPWVSQGKIDMDEANRIFNASRDPVKQEAGIAGGQARLEMDDADVAGPMSPKARVQLQFDLLRVKKSRLTIDQLEKKLVPLASVREFESAVYSMVKNALLVIGAELRDDLAAMADPVAIQARIDDRIHQALSNFATWEPTDE